MKLHTQSVRIGYCCTLKIMAAHSCFFGSRNSTVESGSLGDDCSKAAVLMPGGLA